MQSFFYGGHFLWILFRARLQKFGLNFFAPPKTCLLLHLCFSYTRFIDETDDCNLSASKGSVNVLSTSKMKTIFLLTLDFAAETTRCREHPNTASINIVIVCKQAKQYSRTHHLCFIRAVSWSAQNAESYWSHVHITLTVEHFSFHAFYKKCGLQGDFMSSSSR